MKKLIPSLAKIISLAIFAVMMSACATSKKELPKTSHDGLDLVENTTLGAVYKMDPVDIIENYAAQREAFYRRLKTFDTFGRGRFKDVEPTMIDGEDLDIPTFVRRGIPIEK